MDCEPIPDIIRHSVTWNPWHGCHRVSEGCRNCYMFAGDGRRGIPDSDVVRRSKTQFDLPLRKDRRGRYLLKDVLIGTCLTSDFFIEEADPWRQEAWDIMKRRRDLTFIIPTKRPQRIPQCLPPDWNDGYPNVRLAVSVENQRAWDERIPLLCSVPSRRYDVFMAPMIGPIDCDPLMDVHHLDCIYVGGEYGPGSRVCHYDWVLGIRQSCISHGVSFHWRNCGENILMDGQLMTGLSLRQQGSICCSANIDHIVDNVMPKEKQTKLI